MDLAHGEARESAFVRALQSCQVEHKSDGWSPATGNVAVEISQHGQPSGIMVTVAQHYAIEVQDDVWFVVRTSWLKALVSQAAKEGRVKLVGDRDKYRNVLVPIEWIWRGSPPPSVR